ncbi:hypothetical protein ACJRPK_06455 [Aquimarina sp. 2-A2]|uniref:hypothetical protein n=1 Tax=Aquimarina sp. 2-A2 TaxID=3382644 RepID=UPI00387F30D0
MKNIVVIVLAFVFPFLSVAQIDIDAGEAIVLNTKQYDDIYVTGETIQINATVDGDVHAAGGKITSRDSISQDLTAVGGELWIQGYVGDDIRIAVGKLILNADVGDDLIVAGGEVDVSKDGVVHGNLISYAGDVVLDGKVIGMTKIFANTIEINGRLEDNAVLYAEEIYINGVIKGQSKIVATKVTLGKEAKLYGEIEYWTENGTIDFKNTLIDASAVYNKDLAPEANELSWGTFSVLAVGFWIFYLLSAFLVVLLLNLIFQKLFQAAVTYLDNHFLKSMGYGMLYVLGTPIVIIVTFVILIGIPIGLLLTSFYLFSLFFGHLITALLLAHYLNKRNEASWNFWTITLIALTITAVIRVITIIPILGGIISILLIATSYGLLVVTLLQKNSTSDSNTVNLIKNET